MFLGKRNYLLKLEGGALLGRRSQEEFALEKTPKEIKDPVENKMERLKLYLVVV